MVGVERRPDAGQVHPAHRLNEGKVLRQVSLNGDTGLRQAELPGGLHQRSVPVASIALILGVDHFMSEVRALTNRIGNGVATVVVAKWEGALDMEALRRHLDGETDAEADNPEAILVEHEDLMDAEALGGAGAPSRTLNLMAHDEPFWTPVTLR